MLSKIVRVREEKSLNAGLKDVLTAWGKIVSWAILTLLYMTMLGYLGMFNIPAVLLGLTAITLATKSHWDFWHFFGKIVAYRMDFIKFLIALVFLIWLFFLLLYAPFSAFSGRDEGSYANAAVYLAKLGGIHFQLPLLQYLREEGLAHQSLHFPGFVIQGNSLSSQFSPAYFVFLGFFYLITGTVASFALANGVLILGGVTAFYLMLRLFFPRWISFAGLVLIFFHFLFLWFPRFTLSENLAFFLFFNLLLYLIVFRITKNKGYLWPVFLCAVIFPLARPEGWWLLAVSCAILIFWHFKRNIVTGFTKMKSKILILIGGFMLSIYAAYDQFPIYKRLVRDWLEWPVTAGSYEQLGSGKFNLGAFQNIFLALFPSWERFRYLLKVEWLYGVLFFGFFTLLLIVTFFWTKKSNFFSRQGRIGISIALLLSFPFFTAFVSPQISPDHPWMLRRFLFAVLPLGIFSALMLGINFIKKLPLKYNFTMIAIYLVILLIPTLPATGYFLSAGINDGRKEALEQLADHLEKDDFIFLERGSSGDGWSMWSEPLSSIFGFNSAYVYSPKNISDLKPILYDRFSQGKRNFVVLPEKAYDYEHELQKDFNLILDKDLTFENTELKINKNTEYVNFPLLKRKEYLVKVYLLSPR